MGQRQQRDYLIGMPNIAVNRASVSDPNAGHRSAFCDSDWVDPKSARWRTRPRWGFGRPNIRDSCRDPKLTMPRGVSNPQTNLVPRIPLQQRHIESGALPVRIWRVPYRHSLQPRTFY